MAVKVHFLLALVALLEVVMNWMALQRAQCVRVSELCFLVVASPPQVVSSCDVFPV